MQPHEGRALAHPASHLRLWVFTAVGLAADLWTKEWAFRELKPSDSLVLIEDLCSLHLSLNPGALFGLGAGLAPIFVGASVLALLFVFYLFANMPASRWWAQIALGLVLAGALGNLYDRTMQEAYVANVPHGGRDVGKLMQLTDTHVVLEDFPHGGNRRVWPRPTDKASGVQPVVRDFIKIEAKIGGYTLWPWVFNIADALLVIGVGVLLLTFAFEHRAHTRSQTSPAKAAE